MSDKPRIERAIAGIGLGVVVLGCVAILWPFATTLLWATIIVFSTWPLFVRVETALGGRTVAAAGVMTLLTTALLVAPIVLLVLTLTDGATTLIELVRHWLQIGPPDPPSWVAELPLIGAQVEERWREIAASGATLTASLAPYLGTVRDWALAISTGLGSGIAKLLLSLVIAFFLYCHGAGIAVRLHTSLQRIDSVHGDRLAMIAGSTVRGVLYGVLGTNLMQALLAGFSFLLAGVPGAGLLALLCFFLTLIPFAPTLVWLPALLWLAKTGNIEWAIFVGVWNLIVFGPFESLMRLYLIGRTSDLPLILLLLGMFGGLLMLGLLGLFVGPTLLALGYTLIKEWTTEEQGALHPPAMPAPAGAEREQQCENAGCAQLEPGIEAGSDHNGGVQIRELPG